MQKNSSKNRLLVMDGSHYLYRAYYGVPESAKLLSGQKVNAVYGFMANLRKAADLYKPTHILVVFDSETGTKSKIDEVSTYKATRDYTDSGMYEQLPLIKNILDYLKITNIEPADCEADDYIGTVAKTFTTLGLESAIFSNDRDFFQLIEDNLIVLKVGKKFIELVDTYVFKEMFGFAPLQYVDYLVLKGDSSDNVAGVPGIGNKTAKKLVDDYKSIANLFNNLDNAPEKLKASLARFKDKAATNYKILKINTNAAQIDIVTDGLIFDQYEMLTKSTNYLLSETGVNTK